MKSDATSAKAVVGVVGVVGVVIVVGALLFELFSMSCFEICSIIYTFVKKYLMNTSDFQNLQVWQLSMQATKCLYERIKNLPAEEKFALGDQMRRAAVSIPSNIAEGQARRTQKDFLNFLSIARGSIAEIRTQIMLCELLGYFSKEMCSELIQKYKFIDKMTSSLMHAIQNSIVSSKKAK